MNELLRFCAHIAKRFHIGAIDEGYEVIEMFADYLNVWLVSIQITAKQSLQLKEHLVYLQNILDVLDDKAVALFFEETMPKFLFKLDTSYVS